MDPGLLIASTNNSLKVGAFGLVVVVAIIITRFLESVFRLDLAE
jgi:hypothetical protein